MRFLIFISLSIVLAMPNISWADDVNSAHSYRMYDDITIGVTESTARDIRQEISKCTSAKGGGTEANVTCAENYYSGAATKTYQSMRKGYAALSSSVQSEIENNCEQHRNNLISIIYCRYTFTQDIQDGHQQILDKLESGSDPRKFLKTIDPPFLLDALESSCPKMDPACIKEISKSEIQAVKSSHDNFTTSLSAALELDFASFECGRSNSHIKSANGLGICFRNPWFKNSIQFFNPKKPVALNGDSDAGGSTSQVVGEQAAISKKRKQWCAEKWLDENNRPIIKTLKNGEQRDMHSFCLSYGRPPSEKIPLVSGSGKGKKGTGKGKVPGSEETFNPDGNGKKATRKSAKKWRYETDGIFKDGVDCKISDMEKGCELEIRNYFFKCHELEEPKGYKRRVNKKCAHIRDAHAKITEPIQQRTKPLACRLLNIEIEGKDRLDSCRDSSRRVHLPPALNMDWGEGDEVLCPENLSQYNCNMVGTGTNGDVMSMLSDPIEMEKVCAKNIDTFLKQCKTLPKWGNGSKCSQVQKNWSEVQLISIKDRKDRQGCSIWYQQINEKPSIPNISPQSVSPVNLSSMDSSVKDTVAISVEILRQRNLEQLGKYSLMRRAETLFTVMASADTNILDPTTDSFKDASKSIIETFSGCMSPTELNELQQLLSKTAPPLKDRMEVARRRDELGSIENMEKEWLKQNTIASREMKIRRCQIENCKMHGKCSKEIVSSLNQELEKIASNYPALSQRVKRGKVVKVKGEADLIYKAKVRAHSRKNTKELFDWLSQGFYNRSCDSSSDARTKENQLPDIVPVIINEETQGLLSEAQNKVRIFNQKHLASNICKPSKGRSENLIEEGEKAMGFAPVVDSYMSCHDLPKDSPECQNRANLGWTFCSNWSYEKSEEFKKKGSLLVAWGKNMIMVGGAITLVAASIVNPYIALAAGTLLGGHEVREAYLSYDHGINLEREHILPDREVLEAHANFLNGRSSFSEYLKTYNRNKGTSSVKKLAGTAMFEGLMAALDIGTVAHVVRGTMGVKRMTRLSQLAESANAGDEAARTKFMQNFMDGKLVGEDGEALKLTMQEREVLHRHLGDAAMATQAKIDRAGPPPVPLSARDEAGNLVDLQVVSRKNTSRPPPIPLSATDEAGNLVGLHVISSKDLSNSAQTPLLLANRNKSNDQVLNFIDEDGKEVNFFASKLADDSFDEVTTIILLRVPSKPKTRHESVSIEIMETVPPSTTVKRGPTALAQPSVHQKYVTSDVRNCCKEQPYIKPKEVNELLKKSVLNDEHTPYYVGNYRKVGSEKVIAAPVKGYKYSPPTEALTIDFAKDFPGLKDLQIRTFELEQLAKNNPNRAHLSLKGREDAKNYILKNVPNAEDYEIEYLAEGGFNAVFKACPKAGGKRCKVIKLPRLDDRPVQELSILKDQLAEVDSQLDKLRPHLLDPNAPKSEHEKALKLFKSLENEKISLVDKLAPIEADIEKAIDSFKMELGLIAWGDDLLAIGKAPRLDGELFVKHSSIDRNPDLLSKGIVVQDYYGYSSSESIIKKQRLMQKASKKIPEDSPDHLIMTKFSEPSKLEADVRSLLEFSDLCNRARVSAVRSYCKAVRKINKIPKHKILKKKLQAALQFYKDTHQVVGNAYYKYSGAIRGNPTHVESPGIIKNGMISGKPGYEYIGFDPLGGKNMFWDATDGKIVLPDR